MSPPAPRDIQQAVVAWHNRQPLAVRIDSSQVHSIGWVALPFLRPPQGVEPSLDAPSPAPFESPTDTRPSRRWPPRWWPRRAGTGAGPWPVFSEAFIDGLSARRAAAFAQQHGITDAPEAGEDTWPQRRIEVDGCLAERSEGGWPVEMWVISAAIDVGKARRRVLVAADGRAVEGPRHWRRAWVQALAALGAVVVMALAVMALGLGPFGGAPKPASALAVPLASAASGAMAASMPPAAAAPAASEPASLAHLDAAAPAPAVIASSAASAPAPSASDAEEGPPPDIRPQLVKPLPNRRGTTPPPMLAPRAASTAPAAASASAPSSSSPSSSGEAPRPSSATTAPSASPTPYRGAATPEQLRPGTTTNGPLIALVSPGMRSKAEAETMLTRMTEHLKATMAQQSGLRGEVIESPEGWRAAVYPFATREEAAILNATMVARGWRTRSVTF